jgi:hypothetical protein
MIAKRIRFFFFNCVFRSVRSIRSQRYVENTEILGSFPMAKEEVYGDITGKPWDKIMLHHLDFSYE